MIHSLDSVHPHTHGNLAVLVPNVWSVRNVLHSGVLQLLADAGVSLVLLIRRWSADSPYQQLHELKFASTIDYFAGAPLTGRGRGRSLLQRILTGAQCLRCRNRTYPIFQHWYSRRATSAQRFRSSIVRLLALAAIPQPVYRRLYRLQQRLYRHSYDLTAIEQQLRALAPTWVWSTVSVANEEQPYIFAARELGIPVVTSILGFDNLTSRWAQPRFDHYLLWSESMKSTLLRVLPEVRSSQVTVTGTSQFDFHCREDLVWSRSQTLAKLGLKGGDRYFLYGASAEFLTPDEPLLVAQIVSKMRDHPQLKAYYMVVRLHPLDNWQRWQGAARQQNNRIIISPAWDHAPEPDGWGYISLDDQARFINTLRHAEACINVASTISLDAAALDRPVVCIDFRSEPDCPREILYEEYDAEHYYPLVESGGIRVAHNWTELLALLSRATTAPEEDRENRRRMVERECGPVDGCAAQRVASALLRLLDSRSR